jgi:hypothetical protein
VPRTKGYLHTTHSRLSEGPTTRPIPCR